VCRIGGSVLLARLIGVVAVAAASGVVAPTAVASELIDRNASAVKLRVNKEGRALLTYRARGKTMRVLAWGAVNAIPPTRSRPQVAFNLDYSGGWRTYRREIWKTFGNACGPYRGPRLEWLVTACTAPDGSHWAVQQWQRALPNYGLQPTAKQGVWELRLSHWTGEPARLDIRLNWAYGRYDHLFGRFTYRGRPVYGFSATPTGVPLDTFGRNLYVDTFNSRYGPGWRRENSLLTHTGSGAFCYGFYEHGARPTGMGSRYRATIIGPGVTPDAYWESPAPGAFDRAVDLAANELIRGLGSAQCRPN
jgi:hypothetical protein